jgi:hypothetical protein
MPSAIGLRAYLITIHKKGDRALLPFSARELSVAPDKFLETFISKHLTPTRSDAMERSWYFEEKYDDGPGNSAGYIHYGTFGYESNLKDNKTKTTQYRRQIDDVEEIPLFYEFWLPEGVNYGFVMFQSFAGKSCINLVLAELQEVFSNGNSGYLLKVKKLLPTNSSGGLYNSAPVKKLRLVKRNASRDLTDRYLGSQGPASVNFEVRLSAKRSKNLGTFGNIANSLVPNAAGVVIHDGIEFTEAIAEVEIGGRYRRVGVFGSDTEAGVIDVTEEVTKGKDGHPTFDSLRQQSDAILVDFHKSLSGKKL